MYGVTWKVKGYRRTKYFMSQNGLNRFIGMLKLCTTNTDITVMHNDLQRSN